MTATPPPATDRSTSPLAIVGLVLAFLAAPIGAIISFVAIGQTGEGKRGGRGIAVAGAIIGTLGTLAGIGLAVLFFVIADAAVDEANEAAAELDELADEIEAETEELQDSFQDRNAVEAGEVPDFSSDIVIGQFTEDEFSSTIEVTVTNSGDEAFTYTATVGALSPDGTTQYDSAVVVAESLAPGQSASLEGTFFSEIPEDATFELIDYSRSTF